MTAAVRTAMALMRRAMATLDEALEELTPEVGSTRAEVRWLQDARQLVERAHERLGKHEGKGG